MIALAAAVTVACSLPLYMLGALAPAINQSLPLDASLVGVAMAAYWVAAAIGSMLTMRFTLVYTDRSVMVVSLLLVIAGLVGAGLLATQTWHLLALLGLSGIANGLGHAPANSQLQSRLAPSLQGFGFGVKQAAIPLASVLAGLAVPLLGTTLGWRWGFVIAGLACVPIVVAAFSGAQEVASGRERAAAPGRSVPSTVRSKTVALAIVPLLAAGTFAACASLVTTVADIRGWSVEAAALTLAASCLVGAVLRVIATSSPRLSLRGAFGLLVAMLAVGALGIAVMAIPFEFAFLTGMVLVHGPGWAWPGILHFVAAQTAEGHVSAATGVVQLMVSIGSVLVPVVAGLVVARVGPTLAWLVLFVLAGAAALWAARIWRDRAFFGSVAETQTGAA
ncbi:MFS transporter [Agrococcus sediminis]|uniref:MFS transporter n=1 Tax=Agrococcus sediminis TaxID=2599924 RepID=UPI0037FC220E